MRPTSGWNLGKRSEFNDRVVFSQPNIADIESEKIKKPEEDLADENVTT